MTKTPQDIALEIIREYAPYHRMPAFLRGMADYRANTLHTATPDSAAAQAYDRGAEAQMRINRACGL